MRRIAAFAVAHPWRSLIALSVVIGLGGLLLAASGIVPVKASSGHWTVTEWFLQFSKRRSVATHALLGPAPPSDLNAPPMVMRGAGHFEIGCRPCHGAPGDALPRIAEAMLPPPPQLRDRVGAFDDRELFHVIKHGLKLTGMPAWPAPSRDDEVWSVVAFVRRIPHLEATQYEQLVRDEGTSLTELFSGTSPEASAPDIVRELCARCHGLHGQGRGVGAFPKLAGQRLAYLMNAMHAYDERRRHSGIMGLVVSGMPETARHAALEYYASLPLPGGTRAGERGGPGDPEKGLRIATGGVPERDIPACDACHGTDATINENYPILYGQDREYIAQQLRLLKQRQRGGSEFVHIMHNFVDRLTDEHIADAAAYFASTSATDPTRATRPK